MRGRSPAPARAARGAGRLAALNPLRRFGNNHQSASVVVGMAVVTTILPFIVLMPPFSGFGTQNDWLDGFASAGVFVLLALGLNIVVGMAGLLDLGYAAFFAFGAYAYAFGASPFTGLEIPFWFLLPVGAFVAAVFGVMLGAPTLRLRGDYLAIVTLGFGEIVPIVFLNADTFTNGTNGIGGVYQPSAPIIGNFGFGNPLPYFVTIAALIAIVMILIYRLRDSRVGRAWNAIREDELAAASMGINTVTTKLLAFAIGASTAGIGGVFYASKLSIVSPGDFGFTVSFTILAMVVLGGIGNVWGVAAGAFIVYELQSQGLKQLNTFFQPLHIPILSDINFTLYQFLLYGLALVAMMLLRPGGLFPNKRRAAEIKSAPASEASTPSVGSGEAEA